MPVRDELAELLRRHRSANGLSQRELAARSGLSERGLRGLERGVGRPRAHTLQALADAFGLAGPDRQAFFAAGTERPPAGGAAVAVLTSPTELIGRQREQHALTDLVIGGRHRMITLTGPAGVGKSHLAAALLAQWQRRTDLSVRAADLSAVTDPALVGELVAEVVAGPGGTLAAVERIAAELRGRRFVLVLDRLERLTAAAGVLAEIVRRCPGLTVLATSQRPLRIRGERLVRLGPLAAPDAVELFARRAAAVSPGFELTVSNAPVVAAVCSRVDHLPLAIELAAAKMRLLTPAELDARLERAVEILADGAADLPDRHRSLRVAIESSLELVTGPARSLFAWLAAFPAGTGLADLEAVADALGVDAGRTIAALTELVDIGLVRVSTEADRSRYTLPDMMAELATGDLAQRPERIAVESAMAERFRWRLRQWDADPRRAAPIVTGRDADNLRTALMWTIRHRPGELSSRLVDALGYYYELSGRYVEGDTMLRRMGAAGQLLAWVTAGRLGLLSGHLDSSAQLAQRALDGLDPGNHQDRATAYLLLGTVAAERRDPVSARRHLRTALLHSRLAGNDELVGRVFNNLGNVSTAMGQVRAAEREYRASLVVKRRHGATGLSLGNTLNNLTELAVKAGQPELAAKRGTEAATVLEEAGYRRAAALALSGAALGHVYCGQSGHALAALDRAMDLLDDVGDDRRMTTVVTLRRSIVLHATGDLAGAADLLRRAVPAALEADHTTREETGYILVAHAVRSASRDPATAAGLLAAGTALFARANRPIPPAQQLAVPATVEVCRAALGHDAFRAAYDRGATVDVAVLVHLVSHLGATPLAA